MPGSHGYVYLSRAYTRGVTLFELIIAIAIIALVASTVFVTLRGFGSTTQTRLMADQIRTDLVEMRTRARSGEGRSDFGIVFTPNSYTRIRIDESGATTTLGVGVMPAGITLSPETTVVYSSIKGMTQSQDIVLTGREANEETISIGNNGSVR